MSRRWIKRSGIDRFIKQNVTYKRKDKIGIVISYMLESVCIEIIN